MTRRKRPKISDALNNRTTKTFIGREEQLALFRQNFNEDLPDEDVKWVFNIYGQGGVGKTTLSKQYQSIAKKQGVKTAFLDIEDSRLQNIPALLKEIARQLNQEGIRLSEFDKNYKSFEETLEELSKDENSTPGLLHSILSGTIKTGVAEIKKVPLGGLIDNFDTDGIANKIGDYSTFLLKKFKDKSKQKLMTAPNEVLTTALLEDIDKTHEEVCIIFDTYETAFSNLDEWLRDIYQHKFGEAPSNLFTIISGRDELSEKWNSFSAIFHKILLEQFTEEEAIAFLKSKNITNEAVIKTLVEVSDRFPILLVLFAQNPPSTPEEINDISGHAIARFLKWIKDPVERKVILAASLPRALNLDIVAKLLEVLGIDKAEADKYYNLLNQQPFVQQRGDIKTYHPVVKDQMLTYQFNTSPETWRKQHYTIAQYFHQEAELLGFDNLKKQYNNPKWIQLTIEATYHQLCANFEKELPNAVERMVIHLENERTFQTLIPWADTIAKAGKLVNEKDWSLFIQKGVSALMTNDETIGLAFFERINQQNWIKNNLASSSFYFQAALYLQKIKNYEAAIENYQKAISLNPNHANAYYNLGIAFGNIKNYEAAIENYQKAISLNPKYANAYYNLGTAFSEIKNYEAAIENYQKAISLNPNEATSYNNLGNAFYEIKNYEAAIENYQKAISLNPKYANAYYNLGVAFGNIKNYEAAIENYQKAISLNPNDATAYYNLGSAFKKIKNYEAAIENCKKTITLNPDDATAYYNLGYAFGNIKNYEAAIENFKKAITLNPDDATAYYNLGIAFGNIKNYEATIENYQKAISLNPEDANAYYNLGIAFYDIKNYEAAIENYQKAITLNPNEATAYNNLGNAFYGIKNYEAAIENYQKAISLNPKYANAYYNLGVAFYQIKNYEAAIENYQKAISLNPKYATAYYNLGVAFYQIKNYEAAIENYQKAISLNPDDATAYNNLGVAFKKIKNYEAAIENFQKAISLNSDDATAIHSLGWVYLIINDLENALKFLLEYWEITNSEHAAMNIGHVHLLKDNKPEAIKWYQKSIALWEEVSVFFGGMESDYMDLKMEEKGISKESYQKILDGLG